MTNVPSSSTSTVERKWINSGVGGEKVVGLSAKGLVEAVNAIVDAFYGEERPISVGNSRIFREKIERRNFEEQETESVHIDDDLNLHKENIILETLLDIIMHRSVENALAVFLRNEKWQDEGSDD
jgi:hypothetical protein